MTNPKKGIRTEAPSLSFEIHTTEMMWEDDILLRGGSYFYDFLNSKGKLTEVGPYILDSKIYLSNIEVIYPLGIFKYMEFKIPQNH
jgi:hypothetical protein